MLAAKIKLKPDLAVERINALERAIRERHPDVGWRFVEPDNED